MKKFLFLAFLFCNLTTLFAQNFTFNGLKYVVINQTNQLVAVDTNPGKTGVVTIPASVTNAGTTYSVVSIGYYAFYQCSGLTSVIIPNSVTDISTAAFDSCTGLTTLTIPSNLLSIGTSAFRNCSSLTSITIPNSVTNLFEQTFEGCSALTSVTLPSNLNYLASYMFKNCSALASIIIPNSITSIENSVFENCSSLTSITIPNSTLGIGNYAFSGCTNLANISIPNAVTNIGNYAFSGCSGLTSINLPNSLTIIQNRTFYNCTGLTSITIPNSVVNIDAEAFENCTGLTSLGIPNSVRYIGTVAFGNCSSLTTLTISSSVTSIDSYAFYDCTALTSVVVNWTTPLTVDTNIFQGVPFANVTLTVPAGTSALYITAQGWNNFTNIVEAVCTTSAPTIAAQSLCNGATVASLPAAGLLKWYINATGGTALADTTSLTAGTYYASQTITCESILRTPVTITLSSSSDNVAVASACDSYVWNGTTYTQSGTYTGTTTNCITQKLNLTITTSADNITNVSGCDSYTWNGTTYSASGIYTGATTNCITQKLNLTITPSTENVTSITTCGNINFNGTNFTSSGIYVLSTTNCFSQKLNLTITPMAMVTGDCEQNFNATNTLADIVVTPTNVTWFATIADATTKTSPLLATQVLTNGATYYAVTAGFCLSSPFAVTVGTTLTIANFWDNGKLKVYPNPSNSIFNIDIDVNATVKVIDVLGKQIINKSILSGNSQIDLTNYTSGIYLMKITNEFNQTKTIKIIKE